MCYVVFALSCLLVVIVHDSVLSYPSVISHLTCPICAVRFVCHYCPSSCLFPSIIHFTASHVPFLLFWLSVMMVLHPNLTHPLVIFHLACTVCAVMFLCYNCPSSCPFPYISHFPSNLSCLCCDNCPSSCPITSISNLSSVHSSFMSLLPVSCLCCYVFLSLLYFILSYRIHE